VLNASYTRSSFPFDVKQAESKGIAGAGLAVTGGALRTPVDLSTLRDHLRKLTVHSGAARFLRGNKPYRRRR
jgi:hypothetical protein